MYPLTQSWRVAPFVCLMFLAVAFAPSRVLADTPAAPTTPGATYNILDYGAVGDGQTMNTDSFHKAIEACSAAGGGHVRVPAGVYLTGPIVLMSDVDLHLERGATVLFSRKLSDYPLVRTNWEGRETYRCQSPISGDNLVELAPSQDGPSALTIYGADGGTSCCPHTPCSQTTTRSRTLIAGRCTCPGAPT